MTEVAAEKRFIGEERSAKQGNRIKNTGIRGLFWRVSLGNTVVTAGECQISGGASSYVRFHSRDKVPR
jgi:hypothetical protein